MAVSAVVKFSLVLLELTVVSIADSAKILMIPLNVNSHVVYFRQFADALAAEGHDVTMLVHTQGKIPDREPNDRVHVRWIVNDREQFVSSKFMNDALMKAAMTENTLRRLMQMSEADEKTFESWEHDCKVMFKDQKLLEDTRKANYDFAILDGIFVSCMAAFVYKFDVPYSIFGIYWGGLDYRVPGLTSFVPNCAASSTDKMTFFQRVQNTFLEILEQGVFVPLYYEKNWSARFVPEKPTLSYKQMLHRAKLYFYLADPALGFPIPMMPNTLMLGDVMGRPAKPLPNDLDLIVSRARHGVVLVTFGTMMEFMPEHISRIIYGALGKLKETVVMKKAGFIPENIADNIIMLPWLPQNDLLGHPKVKLFITHCGLNSLIETVYHGKPVLAMPIGLDQPMNAHTAVAKGYARMLTFWNLTSEAFYNELQTLLTDTTYTNTASRLSRILRDKPDSPGKRASFWIQHVQKHGDSHLRTGAFEMNLLQFLLIDVYIFFVALILIMITLCFCVTRGCYRFCSKRVLKYKKD